MGTLRGNIRDTFADVEALQTDTGTLKTDTGILKTSGPSGPTGVGTSFWLKKTVTSSAILSASAVDLTSVSSVGELAVEDVIVKTDGSTGLAGGTNFQLQSNNAKGAALIFSEAVANLGAAKTVDLKSASVRGVKTVLETGKKLQVQSTAAPCTGAGTIDIYILFRRLTAGATVS